MISNTCVAPPVGNGSAGTPSRTTKRIAKLFSSNSSMRLATVFSPSPASQPSSWSLTVGAGSVGWSAEVSVRR
jgi:hypothetical protein